MILNQFILKQVNDIKKKGIKEFFKKIKIFFIFVLILPYHIIFIPIFLLIILISSFLIIRIGKIPTYLFGPLGAFPEVYCCERDERKKSNTKRQIDLFYFKFNEYVSNKQLQKMWKRELIFLPAIILQPINNINNFISKFIPQLKRHDINNEINYYEDRDVNNLFEKYPPHLKFNENEEKKGKEILKKFGLSTSAKFVCLAVRDKAYANKHRPKRESGFWDYHNHRDGDINDYILTAEEVAKRGYWVFRIGKSVEKKLETTNSKIIDYANSNLKSDFMDIYLQAKCSFCISLSSGLDQIAYVFRKPIAHIIPHQYVFFSFRPKIITLFRHYFLKREDRNLSLSEIFSHNVAFAERGKEFENKGVELKHNSPEETRDLAIEVLERFEGKWIDKPGDKELQKKFWSIFSENLSKYLPNYFMRLHGDSLKGYISTKFLRENRDWLQ